MKLILQNKSRFRIVALMALLLALLPVSSLWNTAEAKPPRHAPAYGYRRKFDNRRPYRRVERREYRRSFWRRDDRNRPGYQRRTYRTYRTTRTYRHR